jgi:hypothetical protein
MGAWVLRNKKDNTFTVVIEKDFHYWAGNPNFSNNSFGLTTKGQENIQWIKEELDKFLREQWEIIND